MRPATILPITCAVAVLASSAFPVAITRTYTLKPGAKVQIENTAGNIAVSCGSSDQLIVVIDGEAIPDIAATDTTVTIISKATAVSDRTTDLTITLPQPGAAIDIVNGAGDVSVNRSAGDVRINNGSGEISLNEASGQLEISNGTGNITASWLEALPGAAKLATGVGNITLRLPPNPDVTIAAKSGLGTITDTIGTARGGNDSLVYGNGDSKISCASGIGNIDCVGARFAGRARHDSIVRRNRKFSGLHRFEFHFGGGGGPMITWPDRTARVLNEKLCQPGSARLPEQRWSWGGEGYLQFHRWRIGGMGWGGKLTASAATADTQYTARYEFSMGGCTMEYVLLMNPHFDFSLGGMAGRGRGSLYIAKSVRSDITWNETAGLDKYRGAALQSRRFAGMPFARLKYNLFGWLGLQAQAGYLYCPLNNWKTTDDREVLGPAINASGWTFSLATHFGLQ